jgi:hypothetical protein
MSFANLKKSSKSSLDKITQQVSKLANPEGTPREADNRFWTPGVDKSGNGFAVIRFLPAPDGEDVPFVRIFEHGFQGPSGQWYIERSLTTLGRADPVSEYNSQLWATGIKANQDQVRKQKRKLTFIANIYVVSDKAHPENEGKVFLFKFGKKIFDKLNAAMNPEFEDEEAINPFDFWKGANFKLKIRTVEKYRNYDESRFDSPSVLLDDDGELERIWKSEFSLQEIIDEKHFKSYEDLKQKLYRVLALDGSSPSPAKSAASLDLGEDEEEFETPKPQKTAKPASKKQESAPWDEKEDDDFARFKEMLEDD